MQKEKTLTLLDVIKKFDSDSFIALLKSKHGFSNDESFLDFSQSLINYFYNSLNSFGEAVNFLAPSAVSKTVSSMRTPPLPGR